MRPLASWKSPARVKAKSGILWRLDRCSPAGRGAFTGGRDVERAGSPPKGLGHHLDHDTIRDLPLREVDDSDETYRFRLNEDAPSLVLSLERDGQLTPITVVAGEARYRIIGGFRRTAAARQLGWTTIRAVIYPPILSDEAKKIAFVANVVRRNLTVIEKANAIQMAAAARKTKTLGDITRDRVRVHGIELEKGASAESREKAAAFLRLALRRIEEFRDSDGEAPPSGDTVAEFGV